MASEALNALDQTNNDALRLYSGSDREMQPQTGTTYTFVRADERKMVTASNASQQTYTVPPNSSVPYQIGTELMVTQIGAGQLLIAPGAGVTLKAMGTDSSANGSNTYGRQCPAQWATACLRKTATDTWTLTWLTSGYQGVPEITVSGSYTLKQGDRYLQTAGSLTVTIPTSSSVLFPTGWQVEIQSGANLSGLTQYIIKVITTGDSSIDSQSAREVSIDPGQRLLLTHRGGNVWHVNGIGNTLHDVTRAGVAYAGVGAVLEAVGARRGWRIKPLDGSSFGLRANTPRIAEFRTSTANQGERGSGTYDATGTGISSSGTAANGRDGTSSSVVAAAAGDLLGTFYAGVDFGAGVTKTILEIELFPGIDTATAEAHPRRFLLEVTEGDNVTNWRPVCIFETKQPWTYGNAQIFTVPSNFLVWAPHENVLSTDTASRTLTGADLNRLIDATHATVAIVMTIPPNSSVPFPIGGKVRLSQGGAAACSFTAGAGVTIQVPTGKVAGGQTAGQYSTIEAVKVATDTWRVGSAGDMA